VIHTEEEFDWAAGFYQSNTQVKHGHDLLQMCQPMLALGCGITLAMDWAFICSEQGLEIIQEMQGKYAPQIEFASHLHPWVNPPFDNDGQDKVEEFLSYPGNLTETQEREKLKLLTEKIQEITGTRPTTYLAGRYGVGKNTYKILKELGYKVDVSTSPFSDFSQQQGPDFSAFTNQPFTTEGIHCIAHSRGYISHVNALSDWLNSDPQHIEKLNQNMLGKLFLKCLGVMIVRLSPEGFSAKQICQLRDSLVRINTEHLVYSFHSASSLLGGTPYSDTSANRAYLQQENIRALATLTQTTQSVLFRDCF
jgi:hypothetical protein